MMQREYYVETMQGSGFVSERLVNEISEYLIAKVETREELEELIMAKITEQEARKQALKRAYEELPIPAGSFSLETRREIQEKRNLLVEKYYQEIMNK